MSKDLKKVLLIRLLKFPIFILIVFCLFHLNHWAAYVLFSASYSLCYLEIKTGVFEVLDNE